MKENILMIVANKKLKQINIDKYSKKMKTDESENINIGYYDLKVCR